MTSLPNISNDIFKNKNSSCVSCGAFVCFEETCVFCECVRSAGLKDPQYWRFVLSPSVTRTLGTASFRSALLLRLLDVEFEQFKVEDWQQLKCLVGVLSPSDSDLVVVPGPRPVCKGGTRRNNKRRVFVLPPIHEHKAFSPLKSYSVCPTALTCDSQWGYTPTAIRGWVSARVRSLNPVKGQKRMCTSAVWTLWHMKPDHLSKKELDKLKAKCAFWCGMPSVDLRSPGAFYLSDCVASDHFMVGVDRVSVERVLRWRSVIGHKAIVDRALRQLRMCVPGAGVALRSIMEEVTTRSLEHVRKHLRAPKDSWKRMLAQRYQCASVVERLDILLSLREGKAEWAFQSGADEVRLRSLAQFAAFAGNLMVCKEPAQYLAAIAQYATTLQAPSLGKSTIRAYLWVIDTVTACFERLHKWAYQSSEDWTAQAGHEPVAAIAWLGLHVGLNSLFDGLNTSAYPFHRFLSAIKKQVDWGVSEKLATRVLAACEFVVETLQRCVQEGSLEPLKLWKFDHRTWKAEARAIVDHSATLIAHVPSPATNLKVRQLVQAGQLPSWMDRTYTASEFKQLVDKVVSQSGQALACFPARAPQEYIDLEKQLRAHQYATIAGEAVMAQRLKPFAIMFEGCPGGGKSRACHDLFRAIGRAYNLPLDDASLYDWNMNANFQDGLTSRPWAYTMHDPDHNPAPAVANVPTFLQTICRIVDNVPLPIEQADVSLKGRICGRPLLFMMTTNFGTKRWGSYTLEPSATGRRLIRVRVVPKPEYTVTGAEDGPLDPIKLLDCRDGQFARYFLSFYRNVGNKPDYGTEKEFTRSGLFKLLVKMFKDNLDRESKSVLAVEEEDYCHNCYLPLPCGCASEEDVDLLRVQPELLERIFVARKEHTNSSHLEDSAPLPLYSDERSEADQSYDEDRELAQAQEALDQQADNLGFRYQSGDLLTTLPQFARRHVHYVNNVRAHPAVWTLWRTGKAREAFLLRRWLQRNQPTNKVELIKSFIPNDLDWILSDFAYGDTDHLGWRKLVALFSSKPLDEGIAWPLFVAGMLLKINMQDWAASAFLEELAKRSHPLVAFTLPWVEFGSRVANGESIVWRYICVFLHIICLRVDIRVAVMIHFLVNCFSSAMSWNPSIILGGVLFYLCSLFLSRLVSVQGLLQGCNTLVAFACACTVGALHTFSRVDSTTRTLERSADTLVEEVTAVREEFALTTRHFRLLSLDTLTFGKKVVLGISAGVAVGALTALLLSLRAARKQYQARQGNVAPGIPANFVQAPITHEQAVIRRPATHSLDNLLAAVQHNTCIVRAQGYVHGLCVAHDLVLTTAHQFVGVKRFTITFKNRVYEIENTPFNVWSAGADRAFVRVDGLAGTSKMSHFFIPGRETSMSRFDEGKIVTQDGVKDIQSMCYDNSDYVRVVGYTTRDGDCGLPYIGRVNSSWWIVGIHHMISPNRDIIEGTSITQLILRDGAAALATQLAGLNAADLCFGDYNQPLKPLPQKSELRVAVHEYGVPVVAVGTCIKPKGVTHKTKVQETMFSSELQPLISDLCDGAKWCKPVFHGEMRDGKWMSPYVQSLLPIKLAPRRMDYLFLALADYLSPLAQIDADGYRPISTHEAIRGVEGTTIGASNLRTSTGMPYCQPKSTRIRLDHQFMPFVDPEWLTHLAQIEDIMGQGDVPVVPAVCTLKDEPMSEKKVKELRTRVFNNLPFSYNAAMKKELAPLKAFLREHSEIFESMVGIDMTSKQVTSFVQRLMRKSIDRWEDTDYAMMDKSMDGVQQFFVGLCLFAIGHHVTGRGAEAQRWAHADRSAVCIIKGDVYQDGQTNKSGSDKTVQTNDFSNSLTHRYIYFRQKFPDGLPNSLKFDLTKWMRSFTKSPYTPDSINPYCTFRDHVALGTFGDDGLKSVSPAARFYKPELVPPLAAEVGYTMTDGGKQDTVTWKRWDQVTFLKRSFVWDEELQCYLPPIARKTLGKMLSLIHISPGISRIDHHAIVMMNVLKESVYHGEVFFERIRRELLRVGYDPRFGILPNSNFQELTYQEARRLLAEGKFCVFDRSQFTFQSKMTDITTTSSGIGDAQPDQQCSATDEHAVGTMSFTQEMCEEFPTTRPMALLAKNDIGQWPFRFYEVASGTFLTTDTQMAMKTMFVPMSLLIGNAQLAEKIKNYRFLRGSIEIKFSVVSPPSCYGHYHVAFDPCGGNPGPNAAAYLDTGINAYNAAQFRSAHIDLTEANAITMRLPWVWVRDYYDFQDSSDWAVAQWTTSIWCYAPLRIANGTVTPVATWTAWARFVEEDFELANPSFQAGKNKLSDKAKAVGGVLGSLSTVPLIGGYAQAASQVASGVGSVLSALGFTREAAPANIEGMALRPYSNVANMDCKDTSEVAALSQGNAITIDQTLSDGTEFDPASFAYIFERWTLIDYVKWEQDDGRLERLRTFPVTPFYGVLENNAVTPTTAGYLGYPFSHWRGTMEYKFVFPASKFHRGRVQIAWVPDVNPVTSGNITHLLRNVIVDVAGTTTVYVKVGFAQTRPYLNTMMLSSVNSVTTRPDSVNGYLQIIVTQPLQAPVVVAPVDVLIFARACADMEFVLPKDTQYSALATAGQFQGMWRYQSGALGDDAGLEEHHVLVDPTPSPGIATVGERVDSVRALVQKFYQDVRATYWISRGQIVSLQLTHYPIDSPAANPYGVAYVNGVADPSLPVEENFGFLEWYAPIFMGLAGSCRYKVHNTGLFPIMVAASRYAGPRIAGNIRVSQTAPVYTVLPGQAIEVTVPYYGTHGKFIPTGGATRIGFTPETKYDYLVTYIPAGQLADQDTTCHAVVYRAAGPDTRFHEFRCTRAIVPSGAIQGFVYDAPTAPSPPG